MDTSPLKHPVNRSLTSQHVLNDPRQTTFALLNSCFLCVCVQVDPFEKPSKNVFLYVTLMHMMKEEIKVAKRIKDSEKEVPCVCPSIHSSIEIPKGIKVCRCVDMCACLHVCACVVSDESHPPAETAGGKQH